LHSLEFALEFALDFTSDYASPNSCNSCGNED